MAQFQVFKETALPGTLVANAIYLITHPTNSDYLEIYVTDNAGTATRRIPTEADIQTLINTSIAGLGALEIEPDIASRDALTPTTNIQVLVLDASADPTVDAGAATYVYNFAADTWTKISESESMDLSLTWASIVGGPSSSPAAIDAAVAASHTHANITELNNIDEDGDGCMTYNGQSFVATGNINW